MEQYLSKKLRIISLIAIIMVVFWHSYNLNIIIKFIEPDGSSSITGLNKFIQEFISHGIASISVPLFFIIAGYLFFFQFQPSFKNFTAKYKKRFFSLFIPYILWSVWGIIFIYILQLIPASSPFLNSELVPRDIGKLLYIWLWTPIPSQLWFIRVLMIYVILSPVIYFLISRLPLLTLIILFVLWLLNIDLSILDNRGILFFVFGGYLAYYNINLRPEIGKLKTFLLPAWIGALVILTIMFLSPGFNNIVFYFYKFGVLLGIAALWFSYDEYIGDINQCNILYKLSSYTFFIYASHEPILIIFKKGLYKIMNGSIPFPVISMITYFMAPIIVIIFVSVIGYLLKKYIPKFYAVITGGRIR